MSSFASVIGQVEVTPIYLVITTSAALLIATLILALEPDPDASLRQTHSKAGLAPSKSNLRDQASPAHHHQPQPGHPPRLQSLFIYPLKSCQGIELTRSRVLPTGLEFDRLYTFAQARDQHDENGETAETTRWELLTQRQLPLLASVEADLWLPKTGDRPTETSGALLTIRFPWRETGLTGLAQCAVAKLRRGPRGRPEKRFTLPIDFPSEADIARRGYQYADVKIWKEVTTALNMGIEVPPELRPYLGLRNRLGLFRMDPSRQRQVFRCAPRKEVAGYQPVVDFHDAYPLHLLNLSSLQDLESKMEKDQIIPSLDARRFRANMIVSAAEAYDEETWRSISFGRDTDGNAQSLFDVSCRTVRCKMPNVDQTTGVRHRLEPDRSLRKYRDVDEGATKWGCLGMQLCPMFQDADDPTRRESVLEVGMEVAVLERGSLIYIPQ